MAEWLKVLGPSSANCTFTTTVGNKDDHLPMGHGQIDFGRLFAYLRTERTSPPIITLEVHRPDDVWASLDCLERLWPW